MGLLGSFRLQGSLLQGAPINPVIVAPACGSRSETNVAFRAFATLYALLAMLTRDVNNNAVQLKSQHGHKFGAYVCSQRTYTFTCINR